eukprot:s721_g2.t2
MSWLGTWPWATTDGEANFKLGEVVEYYSASQGSWIPAKVVAVKSSGLYDLDCKPGVPPEKIRAFNAAGAPSRESRVSFAPLEFEVGDVVEYFSVSQNDWIVAKVQSINTSGTYNLDCKPDVPPERVRAQRSSEMVADLSPVSLGRKSRSLRQAGTIFDLCQVQDLDDPVQLLRLERSGPSQRWRYELCPDGVQALQAYGERKIAVVSVCGPSNSGKSYLLNLLLGRVEQGLSKFKVGTGRGGGTDGIWLWAHLDPDDENAPIMAYLDCPGFADGTSDGQLVTLCALLSSVMILNTKGQLNDAVFKSLKPLSRLAEHLQERGQDVSRPALLWVLRDFMLERRDAGNTMDAVGYLEQALHAANAGCSEVRQSLLRFFNHRTCATLVQPVFEDAQLKTLVEMPYKSLRSEFRSAVEAMHAQLLATCHLHPKTVAGQIVGASSFAPDFTTLPAEEREHLQTVGKSCRKRWRKLFRIESSARLKHALQWPCDGRSPGTRIVDLAMPERSHAASSSSSFSTGSTPRDASSSDREASSYKAGFSQTLVRALVKFGASDGSSPSTGSQGEDTTELGSEDASFQSMDASAAATLSGQTTVMLKNVPLKYSQRKLLRELLSAGFQGKMDFMKRLKSHSAEVPLEEVKASRKEKGRDTLGCPVFLRPLPPRLLASFRGLDKEEAPEQPVAEVPTHPRPRPEVAPNPIGLMQCPVEQCTCGRACHGDFCPYCGHIVNAIHAGVPRVPAPGLSQLAVYPGSQLAQPTVALMKQLVESLNDGKPLNVRNAWDAVQHTSCGSLADELRGIASQKLKLLKSGQKLPDDTRLPMTDEALRAFFRSQRHELKERWEEQAVGDEDVRKEYWQELKETLAREEIQVRQQNVRLADQQLSEALKLWQDWLDNTEGTVEEGERVSAELGKLLDRLPSSTVTRGGRSAIEAAARRVAAARTAVSATVEESAETQRRALAAGEQAAKLEGAVRSELAAAKASIKDAMERYRAAGQDKEAKMMELQGKTSELEDGQKQLLSVAAEMEEAAGRLAELKALGKAGEERELSLQQDLEATRALAAKTSAEHLASQRSNEASAEAASLQTLQLQEELREAQGEVQRQKELLEEERQMLQLERHGHYEKHQTLLQELHTELHHERQQLTVAHDTCHTEHQQMLCSARQELEEERKKHSESKEGTKGLLLQHVRHIGTLEGKVTGLNTEANFLKGRIGELQVILQESEALLVKQGQGIAALKKELEKAKLETGRTKSEGEERRIHWTLNAPCSRRIAVALVGAGTFARKAHLPSLQSASDCFELVAIWSRSRQAAEALQVEDRHLQILHGEETVRKAGIE